MGAKVNQENFQEFLGCGGTPYFCQHPDTKEHFEVFMSQKKKKKNTGRILSSGSKTGLFVMFNCSDS